MLRAILNLLAASPAYAVLINLEDLWLESIPQNIPGTVRKQNWTHKARYSLDHISRSLRFKGFLQEINKLRKIAEVNLV